MVVVVVVYQKKEIIFNATLRRCPCTLIHNFTKCQQLFTRKFVANEAISIPSLNMLPNYLAKYLCFKNQLFKSE